MMKSFLLVILFIFTNATAEDNVSSVRRSVSDIFQKSRDTYASLVSYSDDSEFTFNFIRVIKTTLKSKMSRRPDLYRVDWLYNSQVKGVAWSLGDIDYITNDQGTIESKEDVYAKQFPSASKDQIRALSRESIFTEDLVACGTSIPGIFFNALSQYNPLNPSTDEKRLPDDKINDVDCYVFAGKWRQDRTLTIWIGKPDSLIRQIKITKAAKDLETDASKAALDEEKKRFPEIDGTPHDFVTVEIHRNIIVNQKLLPSAFNH